MSRVTYESSYSSGQPCGGSFGRWREFRAKLRKRAKAPKQQTREKRVVGTRSRSKPATGKQKKQQTCLDLLSRQEGATIGELQAVTGWQQHSVRGFLAGAVKKKLGLTLLSKKPGAGARRYRISDTV